VNAFHLLRWFFVTVILALLFLIVSHKVCAQDNDFVINPPWPSFCDTLECGGYWFYFWDCKIPVGGCQ
jgi:hypothetical protein